MGTAQYLSPEQAQGLPVSGAVGPLLGRDHLVRDAHRGQVPFEGESAVDDRAQAGQRGAGAAVAGATQRCRRRWRRWCCARWRRTRRRRFADADEFIAALEHANPAHPPIAPADGRHQRVLQATGPDDPDPAAGRAYQEVAEVEQRYYGPPERRRLRSWTATAMAPDGGGSRCWSGPDRRGREHLVGLGLLLTGKDKVQVPNVVGSPQAESEILLKRKGLSTDVTMKGEPDPAQGHRHRPGSEGGGSRVPKGSVVGLTVSAGPGTARVPDLAGKGRSEARRQADRPRLHGGRGGRETRTTGFARTA